MYCDLQGRLRKISQHQSEVQKQVRDAVTLIAFHLWLGGKHLSGEEEITFAVVVMGFHGGLASAVERQATHFKRGADLEMRIKR